MKPCYQLATDLPRVKEGEPWEFFVALKNDYRDVSPN